jgi:hypothetical protein
MKELSRSETYQYVFKCQDQAFPILPDTNDYIWIGNEYLINLGILISTGYAFGHKVWLAPEWKDGDFNIESNPFRCSVWIHKDCIKSFDKMIFWAKVEKVKREAFVYQKEYSGIQLFTSFQQVAKRLERYGWHKLEWSGKEAWK